MYKTESFLFDKYKEHDLSKLEKIIGYKFKDKLMLIKALSHPSLKQDHDLKVYFEAQEYEFEKLELLGDAVLNLVILEILVNYFPKSNEASLAKFRNHLVCKKTISKIGLEINLPEFWIISDGEKKSGGTKSSSNLENTTEALIGAIYLDSKSIETTKKTIQKQWHKHIEEMNSIMLDPKSSLQELSYAMSLGIPKYELINQEGSINSPTFIMRALLGNKMSAEGKGKSKKEAETNAAQKLLTLLSN